MAAPTPADTKILLHFNGTDGSTTITDSSGGSRSFTVIGDAQLDTAQKKFGTASLENATGAIYTSDITEITVTGDFQVDIQARPSGSGDDWQNLALIQKSGTYSWGIGYDKPSGTLELFLGGAYVTSAALTGGAWNHIRWTHIAGTHKLYLNGVLQGSASASQSDAPDIISFVGLGVSNTCWSGHVDEIRLAMAAEDDGNFTPPTAEFDDGGLSAYAAAGSPLGAVLAQVINGVGMFAQLGDIFGTINATAFHDFTAFIDYQQPMRYVMDLVTTDGLVRVPISSWQATLNVGRSGYGQAVVPNAEDYVEQINAATEFVVSRQMVLYSGNTVTQEMARTPADYVTVAQGPSNYTATVYGYPAEWAEDLDPDPMFDRTLSGIRSMTTDSSGTRVRCAIDYLLKPGQRAYAGTVPIIVGYINYYVPGIDEYMDIGERSS